MAIATGQFTIIDYNDALTLTGWINSNHPKTQIYNPDNGAYVPDWSDTNLVLTPSLFVMGSQDDVITSTKVKSVEWYKGTEKITAGGAYSFSGANNYILTIKQNVLEDDNCLDLTVKIKYHDDGTNLDIWYMTGITINKVINGGGITDAIAMAPNGNVFKNSSIASLTAKVELWRGSTIDSTNVAYQWYMMSPDSSDPDAGDGWLKLTDTSGKYTGVTTDTITLYADAVVNYCVLKVAVKDTDPTSGTYNNIFWDTISFIDNSDPIQVQIQSTGGDVFKNGTGSTVLTARLFRGTEEIDTAGTEYVYTWHKYDKSSVIVSNFGGAGIDNKKGKTLSVGTDDVDVKATFVVEVDKQ